MRARAVGWLLGAMLAGSPLVALGEEGGAPWSYEGDTGPAYWGDLSPDFAACRGGQAQSPVDIRRIKMGGVETLQFRYRTSALSMVNNGRTVQVDYAPGSRFSAGGKDYELKRLEFRTPSEHSRNGQRADMVAQLVHQAADGELAIVAVMIKAGTSPHPELARIWRHMPAEPNTRNRPPHIYINAGRLLPSRRDYFSYTGSLTTPPCTEGVRWFVLDTPVEVSKQQVARIRDLFGSNVRPVQPLYLREVVYAH